MNQDGKKMEHTSRKAIVKEVLEKNYINCNRGHRYGFWSCTYFRGIEMLHNTSFQFSSKS